MSVLSLADTGYAIRFLRLLTMPWEKTAAFKSGVLDKDGNKIKEPETQEEKESYTIFHKLVFNVRRLLGKVPGGKSTLAKYAAALWLIKENTNMDDATFAAIMQVETGLDMSLTESNIHLEEGTYTLATNIIHPMSKELLKTKGQTVDIIEQVDEFYGQPIYKAKHHKSNSIVYVSVGDIYFGE